MKREWITVSLLAGSVLLTAALAFGQPRDDTDAPGSRSGMRLYTDAGTGCQYLSATFSALTPRLGVDGRPICRREAP